MSSAARAFKVLIVAALVQLVLAGVASAGPRVYAPLYYHDPQGIEGFELGGDGALTALPGSPFTIVPGPPYSLSGSGNLAFAPDGTHGAESFFFDGGITGISVVSDGAVGPVSPGIQFPSSGGLAVSPDGRFAYISNGAAGVRAFSLGSGGSLSELPGSPYGAGTTYDIAVSPDGRFLFTTNVTNQVGRYAIGGDGSLAFLGSTPVTGAFTLQTAPDRNTLFVGISGVADGVNSYSIAADGSLAQNGEGAKTGDVALLYFGVAPDGKHLYMPDRNLDAIVTVQIAADGGLQTVGAPVPVENVENVAVSPDGRYLLWSTDSNEGHIGSARIGADGMPTILPGTVPWDSGEPERIVILPAPTPVAELVAKAAAPGSEAGFDATRSQRAVRFDWDFGDGTVLADGGATPRHIFVKPGIYDVKLTVTDAQGCSARQFYTGQTTVCPGGAAATKIVRVDTLPAINSFAISRKRIPFAGQRKRAATSRRVPKRGTFFRMVLTEAARVQVKIERKVHRKFKKARAPLSLNGRAGVNRLRFLPKGKGRPLPPGKYRATAVATDSAGGRSAPRALAFRIVRRAPR